MELFTPEKYSDTVATIALIVSVIAVPASGYFSYKYAIKGERRKEFNAVADSLRVKLREQKSLLGQDIYPASGNDRIDSREFDALIDVAKKNESIAISHLVDNYQRILSECSLCSESGDYKITDGDRFKQSIEALLPYVERK
jgi:hypothetical protein